jgi:hypothetical protein
MFAARNVASMITSSGKIIEYYGEKLCSKCEKTTPTLASDYDCPVGYL